MNDASQPTAPGAGTAEERRQKLVDGLRRWQQIERAAVEQTAAIMERTRNPLVRQLMEIIRNDSVQHHRVQQFLIDSLVREPVTLTAAEIDEVWEQVERHDRTEKAVVEMARELRDACDFYVQRALIDYLLLDEEKHDALLEKLGEFREQMDPSP